MSVETEIQWKQTDMVEVVLGEPDNFLKVRETLTRIGVASRKEKKIYQSCHILHKQGKYYIVHFKELFALDGKNIVRVGGPGVQLLAGPDVVALLHKDVFSLGHEVLALVTDLRGHDDLAFALGVLSERDDSVDLRDHGKFLRPPRLEELGDARKSTRDVLRLGRLARDSGHHVPRPHLLTVLDSQIGSLGQLVTRGASARPLLRLARFVLDREARTPVRRLLHRLDDPGRHSGVRIDLFGHRLAFDDISESHETSDFRDDRS